MALLLVLPNALEAAPTQINKQIQIPIAVSLDVDNVHGFSSREKTYNVEGVLRISAPIKEMEQWLAAGLDPKFLIRFENMVQPWDSILEATGNLIRTKNSLSQDYRFVGIFYSDEIDYRGYPFSALPIKLELVAAPKFPASISPTPAIRLVAIQANSGVSKRSNMNGFKLSSWQYSNRVGGVVMEVVYQPIGIAALVKWLMPLAIAMAVMLLTPNLRSNYGSERLAIPPVILLTLAFMQQSYRDTLPSLPYLTVLDGLYAYSYLVTLVFFCEFIWCANLNSGDSTAIKSSIKQNTDRLEVLLQLASLSGYAVLLLWAYSQA